ncbi:PIG-L family deacetylase [Bacillus sp. FJAT-49732]|uniref:PIG-L family deacetylase n=1 Tax=Lederbergia citrisecunda TaxID=2833583 RepID=A0A942TM39_9BACI|nr:PIG-L family deacetylase [Lederbergia citrisecunda]MBS4198419.1 PIG-L family deacetylase [Lederbergia citrisecunda]
MLLPDLKQFLVKLFQYSKGKIIDNIQGREKLIKVIEYTRGLYVYPKKMLGRKISLNNLNKTDVLVFAAHPDDDVLGLGTTLYRHSVNGDNIKVVFITNGTGRGGESWAVHARESEKKSNIRYKEAVHALSLINIPEKNIYCLGFPDGGTQRYLKNIIGDIYFLINKFNPGRIYVHCIEGGHRDHDLTSFVVKSLCKKISYDQVFEWTEYNPNQSLGAHNVKFLQTHLSTNKETKIDISAKERNLKRKMLACHQSQDVEQYFLQGEAIRIATIENIERDLYEYSQFSKGKLQPIIEEVNKCI